MNKKQRKKRQRKLVNEALNILGCNKLSITPSVYVSLFDNSSSNETWEDFEIRKLIYPQK